MNLSGEEISTIEKKYMGNTKDVFMEKQYMSKIERQPFISGKKKKNKYYKKTNKKDNIDKIECDPYLFLKIPINMREIIKDLCHNHGISFQTLAVKINIPFYKIDNYIRCKYNIDNIELSNILKYFDFDLVTYIKKNENDK